MSGRPPDPARVFVRVLGLFEGIEWGFWLAASVWWVVVLELSPLQLVAMGAVLEVTVLLAETPWAVDYALREAKGLELFDVEPL